MKRSRQRLILGWLLVAVVILGFFSCKGRTGIRAFLTDKGHVPSADGVLIHYKLYGKGDVSIVFVHDWCTNMTCWDNQIPSFAVNYTVVTLDLAGHGQSGKNRTSWSIPAFGQDVAAVVKKLDLEKVVLVGHGMGGPVILEAALVLPERVIGLVGADSFTDLYMRPLSEEKIRASLKPWQEDYRAQMREFTRLTYFSPKSDHDQMKDIVLEMLRTPQESALGALEELLRYDGTESLKKVNLPVRCIQTDFMSSSFSLTHSLVPSLWVDYVEGLGHFFMVEDPLKFNRLLAGYIAEFVTESYKRPQGNNLQTP